MLYLGVGDKQYRAGRAGLGSIRWYISWYEEQFPRAHWKYRLAGVGVLLVALYAALGLKGEGWLSVSFVAATAAFLVSLNAFFAWGAAWRVYFHAKGRRALHEAGWTDSLGRLEQVLAETEH